MECLSDDLVRSLFTYDVDLRVLRSLCTRFRTIVDEWIYHTYGSQMEAYMKGLLVRRKIDTKFLLRFVNYDYFPCRPAYRCARCKGFVLDLGGCEECMRSMRKFPYRRLYPQVAMFAITVVSSILYRRTGSINVT